MAGIGQVPGGLRERKRLRTRDTIVRVALELFAERGYQSTTLVQVAAAAEIAPSTLHRYFRSKEDLVFSEFEGLRDSCRSHIIERPAGQTVSEATLVWVTTVVPTLLPVE